jgi:hypothetical protein
MKRITATAAMILMGVSASPVAAQIGSALSRTVDFPVAQVPFGPGEEQNYRVEWGIFGEVGYGRLAVAALDSMHGYPTYNLQFSIKGGVLFAKVDDMMQSWLDVSKLVSRRFDQNQHEVNYKRHRIVDFFPEDGRWDEITNENNDGDLPTAEPLDDVSFLYFVRTLPLEVGETYTFGRYWKEEGNPVVVNVLRRDSLKVGEDMYRTIVVQPIIKTKGIFSEGGEAEVHFSDDSRRLIVHLRAKMSIGTLKMWLEDYTPGRRLRSSVPAEREDPAPGDAPVGPIGGSSTGAALPGQAPGARG